MNNKSKPELLAPAGNFEKLKVAFHYGADAVYAGLTEFSLRANTDNFTESELADAVKYTNSIGKKIYIALNIYFTPDRADSLISKLKFLESIKPHGIIVSDPGAIYLAKKHCPSIPIHVSTQANTTNQFAVMQYKEIGASRVVLARELTLDNIRSISKSVPSIELECFIHGAMCIAYSGRCLLSSYMTQKGLAGRNGDPDGIRSANLGDCSHSCRWEYTLHEKSRADDEFPAYEDENGTYILSSKDICMIDHIPDLISAGVNCFKIEGRMKSILYISSIVRAYRFAIDHPDKYSQNREAAMQELNVVSHREFSTGFYYDKPGINPQTTAGAMYSRNVRLAAMVTIPGKISSLKVYNTIKMSDKLELIGREMKTVKIGRFELYNSKGVLSDRITHMEDTTGITLYDTSGNPVETEEFDIIRMDSDF